MKRISAVISAVCLLFVCGTSTVAASLPPSQLINEEFVQTTTVNPDFMEWLYGMPKDLRSGTTVELLDYFLQSPFMGQQLYSCSSIRESDQKRANFTVHEAFFELISRKDFLAELENYAQSISGKSRSTDLHKIELILQQNTVREIISESACSSLDYPCLQNIYTALNVQAIASGSYVGSINNIRYYSSGTITTANGLNVEVCVPERELTASEISYFNSNFNFNGNTRLNAPTARYNCHSYAWYRYSTSNPYWIMDIPQFLNDRSCTRISLASAQAKDIIVYYYADGTPQHSGVVYSVDSGNLTICSKWGQAGVYRHSVNNAPYETFPGSGQIVYALFRYHDYSYHQYTGNSYHSGSSHFYQYADTCKICSHTTYRWESRPCSGPPCAEPWSLNPVPEVS